MERSTGASGPAEMASVRTLVVEDFDLLRTLVIRVLRREGHQVVGAATATSAIASCRADQFDLLVTDLSIPGGHGVEVARQAVAANPQLRVLFISGSPTSGPDLEIDGVPTRFLLKPFDIDVLVENVRELLLT